MVYYDIRYCYREKTLNVFARAVSVDIALIFLSYNRQLCYQCSISFYI
uniref:Uncharacterized protein n=1 Tax=Siphoviridae sp. ctFH16 TaxID=2827817 RepID=A0A8S5TN55_9CAUD|nr:MAG TPA: hypothetical protein [Siphoviridae sp. ctFH16]